MSEILVGGLRILFLALLWLFILFVVNVIRTDAVGRAVPAAEARAASVPKHKKRRRRKKSDPVVASTLAIVDGRSSGLKVPLYGSLTVGRGGECGLTIDDDYASGVHAKFYQGVDGQWLLEDLMSTNGTFVNERQIYQPVPVSFADDVRIGRTHLRLEK